MDNIKEAYENLRNQIAVAFKYVSAGDIEMIEALATDIYESAEWFLSVAQQEYSLMED